MKKIIFFIILVILTFIIASILIIFFPKKETLDTINTQLIEKVSNIKSNSQLLNINKNQESENNNKAKEAAVSLKEKVLSKAPFSPQAPFGDWQEPFGEACEEAAIVMAAYWLKGEDLSREIAKKEILALVDYQNKNYGDYIDTTAAETAGLANEFYQVDNFQIQKEAGIEDIIKELNEGNLVIAPMAGRVLQNPYFRRPGPIYHMLLFIGYDKSKSQFITNDAGTKRGKGFRYSFKNINEALADWDDEKKEPNQTRKVIIVISK